MLFFENLIAIQNSFYARKFGAICNASDNFFTLYWGTSINNVMQNRGWVTKYIFFSGICMNTKERGGGQQL